MTDNDPLPLNITDEKLKLLYKIDMFKNCGYDVIHKHLSMEDSYEEIKYSYEVALVKINKIKNIQEDNAFKQFVENINNNKNIIHIILAYLYIPDQNTLQSRLKRMDDYLKLNNL